MLDKKYIDSRISVILFYQSKYESACHQILQNISKSKIDYEAIIVCSESDEKVFESKNQELLTKKKLKFVRSQNEFLKNALLEADGAISIICGNLNLLNLNASSAWINANKKNLNNTVFAAARKVEGKKLALTDKLFNASQRFFTPTQINDSGFEQIIVNTEYFLQLIDNKNITTGSLNNILLQLELTDSPVQEAFISGNDKVQVSNWLDIIKSPLSYFVYLIDWFLVKPINEISSKRIQLSNGNTGLYRLLFFLSALFIGYFMMSKSFDYGLTWDSKLHNQYGYDMLKYFESGGKDTTCFTSHRDYPFYGEHINVIASYINKNYEPSWGEFGTRHLLNSIYGFIAMIFAGLIAKQLLSWRTGLIAFWAIFLTPTFFAHSMNNPTDIPLATGFAIGTYGILKILRQLPKVKFNAIALFSIGLGVAIGSRIVGILLVAYLGLFMGITWLVYVRKNNLSEGLKLIFPYLKVIVLAFIIGYALGLSLWPYGRFRPIAGPLEALTRSSNNAFYAYNLEIWEGVKTYMIYMPWYYVIKFMGITLPLYALLGVVLFFGSLFFYVKNKPAIPVLLVLFTFLFPLVYAEIKNITYYNGWRHYLFIYAPLVALIAVGYDYIFTFIKPKIIVYVLAIVLVGLALKTALWSIKNHPNETVYYNELVGGTKGAYGNYEMDYYANSARQAAEWIANNEPKGKKLVIGTNNEPLCVNYYATQINDSIQTVWMRDYEEEKQFWDYQVLTSRTYSKTQMNNGGYPPKGTVYTVDVDGVPIAAVVKRQNYYMPLGYKAIDNKQIDSAIYYFSKAVEWDNKNEENVRMYGFALMLGNRFDEADKAFDKSIELYPENYSAYANKGLMYFNQRLYDKCIDACAKSTKLKENITEAYYYSALAYLNQNNFNGAIDRLETALKHNGQSPEIFYYLGKAYEAVKNNTKAASNFEFCLGMNPNFKQAWADLANQYRLIGRTQDADFCMQKYNALP
jgi:tetratricopeptide (TPR) repeat protein